MAVSRGRPRRGSLLWLAAALAVAWAVLWAGVALSIWQDASSDRQLLVHGRRAAALVTAAGPGKEFKLGYCRQQLRVSSPIGGPLALSAAAPCDSPLAPGQHLSIVVDPGNPRNVLAATDVRDRLTTQVLPVIGITLAAVAAGYPIGRVMIGYRRRRPRNGRSSR